MSGAEALPWEGDRVVFRLGPVDFYAQLRCGAMTHPPGFRETDVATPQYALVYVVEGEGSYRDESGQEHPLVPGSLFQRFPGRRHSIRMRTRSRKCFVGVPRHVYELMRITSFGLTETPVLTLGLAPEIQDGFRRVIRELQERPPQQLMVALLHMQELIIDLHRRAAQGTSAAADGEWIERAAGILGSHLDRKLPLPDVARALNLSYTTFRKGFAARMGVSPGEYRIRCRVERAMEMLLDPGVPVKAVASTLGYPDVYSFSSQFKRMTGLSPTTFRAQGR